MPGMLPTRSGLRRFFLRVWPLLAVAVGGTAVSLHPSALALVHEALELLAH